MQRALLGDLQKFRALFGSERSGKLYLALEAIQRGGLAFAINAVGGVDLRVAQSHDDAFQRPILAACVQGDRHGGASAERR